MGKPALFVPAAVVGGAVVLMTLDVPRTAPLSRTWLPAVSGLLAWAGLVEAAAYAGNRWPRARRFAEWGSAALFVAFIAAGWMLRDRAATLPFIQLGLYGLVFFIAHLLATTPGQEG